RPTNAALAWGSGFGQESGNKHLVPSLAFRGIIGRCPCHAVDKNMNRPIGASRWNRSGGNLVEFINILNGCLDDYAQSSRNYNVRSLCVAVPNGGRRAMINAPTAPPPRASPLERSGY